MKQTITTTILALSLSITATLSAYGTSAVSYDITLSRSYINYDEPDPIKDPGKGERVPSQRIGGIISLVEGVCIKGGLLTVKSNNIRIESGFKVEKGGSFKTQN